MRRENREREGRPEEGRAPWRQTQQSVFALEKAPRPFHVREFAAYDGADYGMQGGEMSKRSLLDEGFPRHNLEGMLADHCKVENGTSQETKAPGDELRTFFTDYWTTREAILRSASNSGKGNSTRRTSYRIRNLVRGFTLGIAAVATGALAKQAAVLPPEVTNPPSTVCPQFEYGQSPQEAKGAETRTYYILDPRGELAGDTAPEIALVGTSMFQFELGKDIIPINLEQVTYWVNMFRDQEPLPSEAEMQQLVFLDFKELKAICDDPSQEPEQTESLVDKIVWNVVIQFGVGIAGAYFFKWLDGLTEKDDKQREQIFQDFGVLFASAPPSKVIDSSTLDTVKDCQQKLRLLGEIIQHSRDPAEPFKIDLGWIRNALRQLGCPEAELDQRQVQAEEIAYQYLFPKRFKQGR